MKKLNFVLAFTMIASFASFSTFSQEKKLILSYSVGFQAGWSDLRIYSDRTIEHSELICCPPTKQIQNEKPLSVDQYQKLQNLITNIVENQVPFVKKTNMPLGLGYKNGSLSIYENDEEIIVKQLLRTEVDHGEIFYINSAEANELENWLYSLVMVENTLELF